MTLETATRAVNNFTAPMRAMGKAVGGMGQRAQEPLGGARGDASRPRPAPPAESVSQADGVAARLGKSMGLHQVAAQTADFGAALSKAAARISRFAAVVIKAFGGMDAIAKGGRQQYALAKSVGMSAGSLSAWTGLAGEAGFNARDIAGFAGKLHGMEAEGLRALGLSSGNLTGLSAEKRMSTVFNAGAGLQDKQTAVNAAGALMGEEAGLLMAFLWEKTRATGESLETLLGKYKKLNLVTAEGQAGIMAWTNTSYEFAYVFQSALEEITGVIGTRLAPLLKDISRLLVNGSGNIRKAAGSLAGSFQEFWDKTKGLRAFCIDAIKFIGPFKVLLGVVAVTIAGPLIASLAGLTTAFITLSTAIGLTPIGWFLAGVAAMAAGAYLLIRNWDKVSEYFKAFFGGIKAAFNQGFVHGVIHVLGAFNPVSIMAKAVSELLEYLFGVDLFTVGQEWMSGLWDGLKAAWGEITSWLAKAVSGLTGFLPGWIKDKIGLGGGKAQSAAQANRSALPENGKTRVGGTVKVAFENAPASMRVRDVRPEGGDFGLDVDAGYNMMMP